MGLTRDPSGPGREIGSHDLAMPATELLALGRADEHDVRAGRTERFDRAGELTVFELVFDQDSDAPLGERWSRLTRVT